MALSHLIPAIDVHGHYGPYRLATPSPLNERLLSADATEVAARAAAVNITHTIVSPIAGLLPPLRADAAAANVEATVTVAATPGLLQWAIVNPLQRATFDQAAALLEIEPKCVGIKIHPDQHGYPIAEHGKRIFRFAADRGAIILAHSGGKTSMPADFIPFADECGAAKLILAHLGGAWDDGREYQVRAIQQAKRDNVYTDTSSSKSIYAGLIEWAVTEIGVEKILFGTDCPIYSTVTQRARIDGADLGDTDKRKILRDNAVALFAGKFDFSQE
jgi:predicted TIM-barrel fold metal-dependent hydrolase